jgi:hypothetical protein
MIAGWLGAEGVYRYGLGVMSLPAVETSNDLHQHSHTDDSHADPTDKNHEMSNSPAKDIELDEHDNHVH